MGFSVPADCRIKIKENGRFDKYLDLASEHTHKKNVEYAVEGEQVEWSQKLW